MKCKCDDCIYSKLVKGVDESYIVCININTDLSWPDNENCKYYEEENK